MGQQPNLALWVGVIALLKMVSESYAIQMLFTSPILPSEKLSSIICSHVLLPAINVLVGVSYVSLLEDSLALSSPKQSRNMPASLKPMGLWVVLNVSFLD